MRCSLNLKLRSAHEKPQQSNRFDSPTDSENTKMRKIATKQLLKNAKGISKKKASYPLSGSESSEVVKKKIKLVLVFGPCNPAASPASKFLPSAFTRVVSAKRYLMML